MRTALHGLVLLALTAGGVATAAAETFRFAGGSVEIPAGFTGPVEQRHDGGMVLYGFSKRHDGRPTATLMQITVYQPPGAPRLPAEQEPRAGERYLLQILAGVERRRTDFSRGAVEPVTIGGKGAAKVTWRGRLDGAPMRGVMYCVVDGSRVLSFHTQDFDVAPPDAMTAAVRAFESAALGDGASASPPPAR